MKARQYLDRLMEDDVPISAVYGAARVAQDAGNHPSPRKKSKKGKKGRSKGFGRIRFRSHEA